MTKMDHTRPILELIDEIKRKRSTAAATTTRPKLSAVAKKRPAGTTAENILIHHAACSVLIHIGKHNDVRMVDKLLEGVAVAQRKRLRNWFSQFGPIYFVGVKATYRRGAKTALGQAMDNPFGCSESSPAFMPSVAIPDGKMRACTHSLHCL